MAGKVPAKPQLALTLRASTLNLAVLLAAGLTVNPFYKQDKGSAVQCVALRLSIQDGHIAVDWTIAAQSDKLDVVAAGAIDLGAQTVDLASHPSIQQGLGVGGASLAQPVTLHGSLALGQHPARRRGSAPRTRPPGHCGCRPRTAPAAAGRGPRGRAARSGATARCCRPCR